jgi:hypothetical protein
VLLKPKTSGNKYNVHGIYVRLPDEMISEADSAAERRMNDADRYHRKLGRAVSPEKQMQTEISAARAERAGKFWFDPCKWNEVNDSVHMPDLELPNGFKIDVKSIGRDTFHLIVPKDNPLTSWITIKPEWFYVLISTQHHPIYWLMGWLRGEEILRCETAFPERPAYKADAIHEIYLLNQMIKAPLRLV